MCLHNEKMLPKQKYIQLLRSQRNQIEKSIADWIPHIIKFILKGIIPHTCHTGGGRSPTQCEICRRLKCKNIYLSHTKYIFPDAEFKAFNSVVSDR